MSLPALARFCAPILVLAVALACVRPETAPGASDADIRAALATFSETSGRGDLAGVLALFDDTADIQLVGSDQGEVFKGRAAMEGWLSKLYRTSGFAWQMDRVDVSRNGDTAWAFVEGRVRVTEKATGKLRFSAPYRFSAVLVRKGSAWRWRLFHGSAPGRE